MSPNAEKLPYTGGGLGTDCLAWEAGHIQAKQTKWRNNWWVTWRNSTHWGMKTTRKMLMEIIMVRGKLFFSGWKERTVLSTSPAIGIQQFVEFPAPHPRAHWEPCRVPSVAHLLTEAAFLPLQLHVSCTQPNLGCQGGAGWLMDVTASTPGVFLA